jgi:S1-C subfamily serine protease
VERGQVILELNRRAVDSVAEFRRLVTGARAGDVLVVLAYDPSVDQRAIYTVRTEPR